MPGIFGFADVHAGAVSSMMLRAMAASMRHYPSYGEELHTEPVGVGLGRLRLEFQPASLVPSWTGKCAAIALVDGEIYDAAQHRQALRNAGCNVGSDSLSELVAAGHAARGKAFFRELHAKFAAAIYDRQRRQLILVNDRFGMRPLYYAHLPGRLLFASEIKALLTDPEMPRQTSLRGIAEFFTFGQFLGENTLLESVQLLPAAGYLTYDLDDDRVQLERYWQPERKGPAHDGAMLDRIDHAFVEAVQRSTADASNVGLSLSGGLDSRTILAVIDDQLPVTTISVGMPGSADHRSAAEMARLTSRPHHECLLGAGFLESFEDHLRKMVHLTDGHYLSQCIVMPTLEVYRDLEIQVLLRGHAGELMHMRKAYSFSLDAEALSLRDSSQLQDWLFRHLQSYLLVSTGTNLFAAAHRHDIEGLSRESLRSCLGDTEGIEPAVQRIWHLFLSQRVRRETALSLVKFGSVVETRLPYLDNELVDALLAAPPDMKLDETIQAHILRRRRPAFLNVVNVNTGARVDAGRLGRFVGKARQKILGKLGVRGFQPYERLGLWLRQDLEPLVRKLLLCEECLGRGVFDADVVRTVVDEHVHGKNHTFLILALMIFEMGQREFMKLGAGCNGKSREDAFVRMRGE
jgi:asparagine synthase (glutamine-hydrolysing)